MEIIPAIDLQNGACVRLYQGDFEQATVYSSDPVEVAQQWERQGAKRLHLVDLDGAKAGQPVNTAAIQAIVRALDIPVQLGGGLRTLSAVEAALQTGVQRVIVGTAAVNDPALVQKLVNRYADQVIVAIDARDGLVATNGWLTQETVSAAALANQMAGLGVARIIYTDISRDGTLTEPNYLSTAALVQPSGPAIIASGGIASIDHLRRLATLGLEGAIVGRALYTGAIELAAALAALPGGITA